MRAEATVVDVDYVIESGEAVVRLFCVSEDGGMVARFDGFDPYFYALPEEDVEGLQEELEGASFDLEGEELEVAGVERVERLEGRKRREVLKVEARVPPEVPKLRKKVSQMEEVAGTREFDIPFYKRFLMDMGVRPAGVSVIEGEEVESGEFDTVVEAGSVESLEEAEDPSFDPVSFDLEVVDGEIVMCSFYGERVEKLVTTTEIDRDYVETVSDEEELIKEFVGELRRHDLITGYNTDEYDFRKLRERAEHHGVELSVGRGGERMKFDRRGRFSSARVKGRMHLDLYPLVEHILSPGLESETLDLGSVSEELLGDTKDEMSFERLKSSWRNGENLEEMADYALKDSELACRLSRQLVPQILELSRITGLIPFDACRLTYGQLTENYLLREANSREILAPNRPFQDERRKRAREEAYEGGFVYSPEPGLYEDIALLDFRSLYPTVMVSHNISPETLNLESCGDRFELEELGYDFCQDEQGFFPELLEELIEERSGLKDRLRGMEEQEPDYRRLDSRQRALKVLANSFYGYLGYEGARWYSREAAESTTYLGREYIEDAIDTAEEMGFEVVYGDTDSVFLRGGCEVSGYLERVNSELPGMMELELEGRFSRGFFTSTDSGEGAKKKYALLGEDGSMKVAGFEFVRRDWSPVAKETQREVLRKVLEGEPEEAAGLVKQRVDELRSGDVPLEDLGIYTTLTKSPEEYESTAPHVEAAKKAKRKGEEVEPGETVEYIVTRGSGSVSERAEVPKFADSYDADYYVENQLVPVAHRVLKVFGYTEDQLKGEGRQSDLDSFG